MNALSSHDRLKKMTSIEAILKVAVSFEASARDFYSNVAPRVSKNLRYLVEELAKEEEEHFQKFSTLLQQSELSETFKLEIERPANDHKFSDCIQSPNIGKNPDDQTILQYALMREHAAMEQYRELAESVPHGPIQELFKFLANEETLHKNELEKRYYEIVHSGGV